MNNVSDISPHMTKDQAEENAYFPELEDNDPTMQKLIRSHEEKIKKQRFKLKKDIEASKERQLRKWKSMLAANLKLMVSKLTGRVPQDERTSKTMEEGLAEISELVSSTRKMLDHIDSKVVKMRNVVMKSATAPSTSTTPTASCSKDASSSGVAVTSSTSVSDTSELFHLSSASPMEHTSVLTSSLKSQIRPNSASSALKSQIRPNSASSALKSQTRPNSASSALKSQIRPNSASSSLNSQIEVTGQKHPLNHKIHVSPKDLIEATKHNKIEDVRALLDRGVNVNSSDNGLTVLHIAAANGNIEVVSLLLKKGASFDARDSKGFTPMHHAVVQDTTCASVSLLIAKGANVNARNYTGRTPLHVAAVKSNAAAVCFLLQKGADKTKKDMNGKTAQDLSTKEHIRELLRP